MMTMSRSRSRIPYYWADEPALGGWYPGRGEEYQLGLLPNEVREFLADACSEYPPFLREYLVPTLGEVNSHEIILKDLSDAITDYEISGLGLGDFGNLGKSFFKRIKKAVSRVVKKVERPVAKVVKRATKEVERVYRKEGDVIVGAIGAVLAPFTGGASLAAASLITGAHKMYQTKKAAQKAKKQNNQAAAGLANQSAAQEQQTTQQVDQFFNQNQPWFASHGITPAQWGTMTLQQKLDTINSGATGAPVGSPSAPGASVGPAAPSAPADAGGGGGSDGGGGGGAGPSEGPSAGPQQIPTQGSSVAGGMSSMLLPAAIIAGAVIFSGGSGGSRRTRRNPSRSGRSGLGRGKRPRSRRRW